MTYTATSAHTIDQVTEELESSVVKHEVDSCFLAAERLERIPKLVQVVAEDVLLRCCKVFTASRLRLGVRRSPIVEDAQGTCRFLISSSVMLMRRERSVALPQRQTGRKEVHQWGFTQRTYGALLCVSSRNTSRSASSRSPSVRLSTCLNGSENRDTNSNTASDEREKVSHWMTS
jgi:hypothetical protein